MERDLLMLSQRLMPTTADTTDMPDHTPTDMPDTDMVVMDVSSDKLNTVKKLKSKQSKLMTLSSQKIIRNYCWCRNLS